jgi:hypothetical protein
MEILELIRQPWPWYIAGPLVGLTVPALLYLETNLWYKWYFTTHLCDVYVSKYSFFTYDWKRNMEYVFVLGILIGGVIAFSFCQTQIQLLLTLTLEQN